MAFASGLFAVVIGLILFYGAVVGAVPVAQYGFRVLMVDRRRNPVGYLFTMAMWLLFLILVGSVFIHDLFPTAPSIWAD